MAYGTFAGILADMNCRVRPLRWAGCEEIDADEVIVPPSPGVKALARVLEVGERVWALYWEGRAVGLRR
jgi:hypothetical protein